MQLLARTLRYLAKNYLADPGRRVGGNQSNLNTARTNAAEASASLRQRRHERDEVDAYLQSRSHEAIAASGQDDQGSERL